MTEQYLRKEEIHTHTNTVFQDKCRHRKYYKTLLFFFKKNTFNSILFYYLRGPLEGLLLAFCWGVVSDSALENHVVLGIKLRLCKSSALSLIPSVLSLACHSGELIRVKWLKSLPGEGKLWTGIFHKSTKGFLLKPLKLYLKFFFLFDIFIAIAIYHHVFTTPNLPATHFRQSVGIDLRL